MSAEDEVFCEDVVSEIEATEAPTDAEVFEDDELSRIKQFYAEIHKEE